MTEETIFSVARQKPDLIERAAFLDEACGDDHALRARVQGLLQSHEGGGDFLAKPVAEWPTGSQAPPRPSEVPPAEWCAPGSAAEGGPAAGARVGPYKLLQQIGAGGMGIVWMAEQVEPVRRRVALKVIKAGMDSAQVLARFDAERQALALMDHPNIAKVLDAGSTEAGWPYFVMELVKGVPMTRFCDENRLTPRERLELFIPVCEAVQHAHQKGIIHRDLKPSNVLVASYDGRPVPKVIDFGVAKAVGQQLTERTLFTGFGALIGTLEYMSPEQAEFNALDIDTRSDVYALGAMLYELLTGSTPLPRHRLKQSALTEALRVIHDEEPPRPSTRLSESRETLPSISAQRRTEPAQLTRLMRGELDWIVMRALEKDRNRRYETANGLARDLQRYLDDEPVEACPPSTGYRLRKLARKHRGFLVTAAAFLALLVTAVAVSTCLAVWATKAESVAEDRFNEARAVGKRLQQNERVLRTSLYASRSALIQSSWEADDVARAVELLDLQRPGAGEPDLRGFEWYYWHRLCHAERRTIWKSGPIGKGLDSVSRVEALLSPVFSPDGRYLATPISGDYGLDMAVIETSTGEVLLTLKAAELLDGERAVCALAFSPNGSALAGAVSVTSDPEAGKPHSGSFAMRGFRVGDDGKTPPPRPGSLPLPRHVVKVWDVATGKERVSIAGNLNVGAVALSPGATRIAVSGAIGSAPRADQEIQIWSVVSTGRLLTLSGGSPEGGLIFSPDGARLAAPFLPRAGNSDAETDRVKIWDTNSGKELLSLPVRGTIASRDLAFSPDGKRLAAGVSPHFRRNPAPQLWHVQVWDAITGRELLRLRRNGADGPSTDTPLVSPVAFSPDGLRLASIEDGRIIKIWDAISGDPLQVLKGHKGVVETLAFSADGTQLHSAEMDLIKSWDVSSPARQVRLPDFQKKEHGLTCATPDYGRIVTVVGLTATNPDGERVEYYLSDLTGKDAVRLDVDLPEGYSLGGLAWRSDGKQIAGMVNAPVNGPAEARVWDGSTGKLLHRFRTGQGKGGTWSEPLFRRDGTCIVAVVSLLADVTVRNLLQIWDVTGGSVLFSTETNYNGINSLTFSSDGGWLAAHVSRQMGATFSEDVRLWDVSSGQEVRVLPIRHSGVTDLVFSPDGARLLAHLDSGVPHHSELALLWDVATGNVLSTLKGHAGIGSRIGFSPDGRRIVSCSARLGRENEAQIHIWDAASGNELATLPLQVACYRLNFSPDGHRLFAVTEGSEGFQQAGILVFRPNEVTRTGQVFAGWTGEVLRIWDATPRPEEPGRAGARKAANR